jgi:hypothetical protein
MSLRSREVRDATVAIQDAANAAFALGHAASVLLEVLKSIADLEARVEALERTIILTESVTDRGDRDDSRSQPMLLSEMRSHVDTNTAAGLLGRRPQTLRKWACYEDGPLRPSRVNGRLAWAVAEIRRLLNNGKL